MSMAPPLEKTNQACNEPLPANAVRGLEYFNMGQYFEAHEYLETAWRDERREIRDLYRGVLQVAVGYYHLTRGNYIGAQKMFSRSRKFLDLLPEVCQGVNLAQLRQDMDRVEAEMTLLGPERVGSFNRSLLKKVEYHL
jgi:predicted metal-dependent hydrolase